MNRGEDSGGWTGWVIVFVLPGIIFGMILQAAVHRYGAVSVTTIFTLGWIGQALFHAVLRSQVDEEA